MTCAMLNLCGSYTPRKVCGGKKVCPRRKICALWKISGERFEEVSSRSAESPAPPPEPRESSAFSTPQSRESSHATEPRE